MHSRLAPTPQCLIALLSLAAFTTLVQSAFALQPPSAPATITADAPAAGDWQSAEAKHLTDAIQLTSRSRFIKAGEAYFNHDDRWIIFQAVEVPQPGNQADPFYAMFVAPVRRSPDGDSIIGLGDIIKVSEPGTANTCGWFDPVRKGMVLFGSTITTPTDEKKSGFQVGSRRYVWMFPTEMELVQRAVLPLLEMDDGTGKFASNATAAYAALRRELDALKNSLKAPTPLDAITGGINPGRVRSEISAELLDLDLKRIEELAPFDQAPRAIFSRPNYDAECSYSSDGRFLLYTHVEEASPDQVPGKPDANIYIYDVLTSIHHPIIIAPGYDGGPFFSPDNKRIVYRSDRKGNDLLQLFIADLSFVDGVPTGISHEYQLTNNQAVNWAPYFHPSGEFIVYASSEVGHHNYEVFSIPLAQPMLDAAAAQAAPQAATQVSTIAVTQLPTTRITHAPGADVLPAFTTDGRHLMWTSQRGPALPGEERPSSQIWIAKWQAQSATK